MNELTNAEIRSELEEQYIEIEALKEMVDSLIETVKDLGDDVNEISSRVFI